MGGMSATVTPPRETMRRPLSGAVRSTLRRLRRQCALCARMMLAMHCFQAAEREVGVDLRGGDVGVAEQGLHAAQVGAVLHHVRGATVAQAVGAGGVSWQL